MNAIVSFFKKIAAFFTSGKAKAALDKAASLAAEAAPFVGLAADIVTTLTPSGIDDLAWGAIKSKFPRMFDGSLTVDERKLYMLAVAAELLQAKFPAISTSVARAAVQAVYTAQKA